MEDGAVCNVTRMDLSVHTGTHMDAPLHFIRDGAPMDAMPIEATVGVARVLEIRDRTDITRAEIEPHDFQRGERILFKTANSESLWNDDEFHTGYIAIDNEAAKLLVERGVQTVGVDYLSVAPWRDLLAPHITLLGAGVWVIEGLDLRGIAPGLYDMICLPLKIVGSDGSPARVCLRAAG